MLTVIKSIAAALLILAALLLYLGQGAADVEAQSAILFSQPPDPAGGLYQSSWWSPDESNSDKFLWDNFTLTNTQEITEIQWRGGYDPNVFNGAGTVVDFEVAIFASNGAEPAYLSGPLVAYATGGNAGETFAGIFGGAAMYDYSFTLPAAFQAQGGTKYWVYIVAEQTGNPDWGLSKATGGDTQHFRLTHDGSIPEFRSGDLAFTLLGPSVPISGLNATNDGPTALGQATTFTATVSSGSDVSYDWDFGDQSSGSGAVVTHSYAAAGNYTAVVTASNTLGSESTSTAITVMAGYGVFTFTQPGPNGRSRPDGNLHLNHHKQWRFGRQLRPDRYRPNLGHNPVHLNGGACGNCQRRLHRHSNHPRRRWQSRKRHGNDHGSLARRQQQNRFGRLDHYVQRPACQGLSSHRHFEPGYLRPSK